MTFPLRARASVRSLLLLAPLLALPVGGRAGAQVGAAVGASSVGRVTTTTRVTVSDVRASAVNDAAVEPATLAAIRRDLGGAAPAWTVTLGGKTFTAVTARGPEGVTLRTTVVLGPPDGPATTVRTTRTLGVDGPGPGDAADVDGRMGAADVRPVGWPLDPASVGGPVPPTDTLDAAPLPDLLLRAVAGADTRAALRSGTPPGTLPVTTAPPPAGPGTDGSSVLDVRRAYGPWTVTLGGRGTLPRVTFTLDRAAGQTQGTVTVRPDGLIAAVDSVTRVPVQVTLVSRGVQVTLTVTVEQRTEVTPG